MEQDDLIILTADIVAAHVANNSVAISDMPLLVQRVHEALSGLGRTSTEAVEEKKVPAVSVRSSIKPDSITCLECGKKFKGIRRHLKSAHDMTPDQYREAYGLPSTYPLVAPSYSEQRRDLARSIGLGRKPRSDSGGTGKSQRKSKASGQG